MAHDEANSGGRAEGSKLSAQMASSSRALERRGPYRLYLALTLALIVLGVFHRNALIAALFRTESTVRKLGPWAPVAMAAICGGWATLCLPGPVILGLVGTMFASKPLVGLAVVTVGDTIAAILGFQIARHLGRERIRHWLEKKSWFEWLELNTEKRGYYGVMFVRMMPFFPNSLANYALGLTALRFWPYLLATVLGSIPCLSLYVFGTAGTVALLRQGFGSRPSLQRAFVYLVLVALVLRGLQGFLRRRYGSVTPPSSGEE